MNFIRSLSLFYYVNIGNNTFVQTKNPVWIRKNNHGDHWQFSQVQYDGGNKSISNFIFEGSAHIYDFGDIAIGINFYVLIFYSILRVLIFHKDDIILKFGECEPPDFSSITCNFEEEHICGYESDETGSFNWERVQAGVSVGPSIDVKIKLLIENNISKIIIMINRSQPEHTLDIICFLKSEIPSKVILVDYLLQYKIIVMENAYIFGIINQIVLVCILD